jgi:hypothetical protein
MGYSSKHFAEMRQDVEYDADHMYYENNTFPCLKARKEAAATVTRILARCDEDRRDDAAFEAERAQRDAVRAYNREEYSRVEKEIKYFRGNDAEKFFALKAYLKALSEKLRA